jgi:hypothetical protein
MVLRENEAGMMADSYSDDYSDDANIAADRHYHGLASDPSMSEQA